MNQFIDNTERAEKNIDTADVGNKKINSQYVMYTNAVQTVPAYPIL